MIKKGAVYFYQYLPPWRIDIFNELAKYYTLTIVFWNSECEGFTYDRQGLLAKLDDSIETIFLTNGISAGTHSIRFGVLEIIRKRNPKVVFSHEFAPISMQCVLYRMLGFADYKLYLTTSDNVQMAEESSGLKKISRDLILNKADGAILYSKDVERWYKKQYPKLKTDVCPNIQNPNSLLNLRKHFSKIEKQYKEDFNLKDKKIILFTGRLNYVKGLDLLLEAFSKLDNKNWVLVLVGEGKEEETLKLQAKNLGITNKVVFAGFYSGLNLYAWYDMANFFILPSRYEPFGAVINEALIYGCPVVTSKFVGALDFVNRNNGIVFNPLDLQDFQNTLNEAMNRYSSFSNERKNLMSVSFEQSARAFIRIANN